MSTELDSLRNVVVPCQIYKLSTFPSEDTFDNLLCAILDNNGVVINSVPQAAQQTRTLQDKEDSYVQRRRSHHRNPVSLTRELLLDVSYVIAESCGCPPYLALVRILQRLRKWRLIALDEPEREASHVARLLADITNPPLSICLDTKPPLELTSRSSNTVGLEGDAKGEVYITPDQTNCEQPKNDPDPSGVRQAPSIPSISPHTRPPLSKSLQGWTVSPCAHFRNGCPACCVPRPSSASALESSLHQIEDIPSTSITTVLDVISQVPGNGSCTDPDGRRDELLYPKAGSDDPLAVGRDTVLPQRTISPESFCGTESNGRTQMPEDNSSKLPSRSPKTPQRLTPSQPRKLRNALQRNSEALSASSSAYNSSQAIPPIPTASQTPLQKIISRSISSVRVRRGENFNPRSTTPAISSSRRDVLQKATPNTPHKRTWRP